MTTIPMSAAWSPLASVNGGRVTSYPIDARLDAFVDSAVSSCREHGDSLDDTVDVVAELVRTAAPTDMAENDPHWEARWRSYFAFYDHALMHAIRSYVGYERDLAVASSTTVPRATGCPQLAPR